MKAAEAAASTSGVHSGPIEFSCARMAVCDLTLVPSKSSGVTLLEDVRIIDLTRLLPGPFATWLLRGMGADVIKVEQPGRGDYLRWTQPRRGSASTVFHLYNRGKRLVSVNLKQPEGRAALCDMVASADVLIEGFRPGVLQGLGLGWDALQELRPSLVYCSLTGFGQDSPYRDRVGHDVNYLSIAGLMDAVRDDNGAPVAMDLQLADMGGAVMAVAGILAALHSAKATGSGRFLDVSLTDAAFPFQGLRLAECLLPGDRQAHASEDLAGTKDEYGVYRTKDGRYLTLDPYEPQFKDALWRVIEAEGIGWRPVPGSGAPTVRAALARAIAARTAAEWDALFLDVDSCYACVLTPDELPDEPHVATRRLLGDAMDPTVASPTLGFPLRFVPDLEPPAPSQTEIGAHTEEVLREVGWDQRRIEHAVGTGAVAVP